MKKKKQFDCVEMKRKIQEEMYEETKNLTHEEFLKYLHKRIANSRFSYFLNKPAASHQSTEGKRHA